MITSNEQHEPTQEELINSWMAELWHHPVFTEQEAGRTEQEAGRETEIYWMVYKSKSWFINERLRERNK